MEPVADALTKAGATTVEMVHWDATDVESHRKVIDDVFDRYGDIDLVYAPAGILGSQEAFEADPVFAAKAIEINFAGLVSACLVVADRLKRPGPRRDRPDVLGRRGACPQGQLRLRVVQGRPRRLRPGPRRLARRNRRPGHGRPAGIRAHQDDRGHERGAVLDHARQGRRPDRLGPRQGPRGRVGARHPASSRSASSASCRGGCGGRSPSADRRRAEPTGIRSADPQPGPTSVETTRGRDHMDVVVTGSSGLIGSRLVARRCGRDGHQVVRLVRSGGRGADTARWDPDAGTIDAAALDGADAVVHLAGESIASSRWTDAQKARIMGSRVKGTTLLADTLAGLSSPPTVFLSGSAVGYYGDTGDTADRRVRRPAGDDFPALVCQRWEACAQPAIDAGDPRRRSCAPAWCSMPTAARCQAQLLPFKLGLGGTCRVGPAVPVVDHARRPRPCDDHVPAHRGPDRAGQPDGARTRAPTQSSPRRSVPRCTARPRSSRCSGRGCSTAASWPTRCC